MELKARGDEAANIGWARALEEAGVHVVYGLVGLKTHAKTRSWSARRAAASAATATSAPATTTPRRRGSTRTSACSPPTPTLGADLTDLFNYLTGYSRQARLPPARRGPALRCARRSSS